MFHPALDEVYRLFMRGMSYVNDNHVYKFKDYSESIFETQIQSKLWLSHSLRRVKERNDKSIEQIDVIASWYGIVMVPFLKHALGGKTKINLYDVDWYTTEIASHIFKDSVYSDTVNVFTKDVVFDDIDFAGDTLVNCSCEHMFDMKEITKDNKDKLFAFQSNDNRNVKWLHINCVDTPQELAEQAGLSKLYMEGTIKILQANRIMVIGEV